MLAEAEGPKYHTRHLTCPIPGSPHLLNAIAQGKKNVRSLDSLLVKQDTLYPADAYRMLFTSNHDENSWKGRNSKGWVKVPSVWRFDATLPACPDIQRQNRLSING